MQLRVMPSGEHVFSARARALDGKVSKPMHVRIPADQASPERLEAEAGGKRTMGLAPGLPSDVRAQAHALAHAMGARAAALRASKTDARDTPPVDQYAALCLVFDDQRRVLTVSRPEPPNEQSIPGGMVDPGEGPDTAAARELLEETGVVVHDLRYVTQFPSPLDGRPVQLFVAGSFTGDAHAAEAGTKVAWMTVEDLVRQAVVYRPCLEMLVDTDQIKPQNRPPPPHSDIPRADRPPNAAESDMGGIHVQQVRIENDDGLGAEVVEDAKEKYVVVHHTSEGPVVTLHASKKEATEHGKDLRSNGATAYVFPSKTYTKNVDPSYDESKHEVVGPHQLSTVYKAEKTTKAAKDATKRVATTHSPADHVKAAEAHIAAAKAHTEAAKASPDFKAAHEQIASLHEQAAEVHATAAGSDWDEAKHPRDENGKFTSDGLGAALAGATRSVVGPGDTKEATNAETGAALDAKACDATDPTTHDNPGRNIAGPATTVPAATEDAFDLVSDSALAELLPWRIDFNDEEARDEMGRFAAGGGGGSAAKEKIEAAAKAGKGFPRLTGAFHAIAATLRKAPAAIVKGAVHLVKEKVAEVKNAGLGVKHFLTGQPVSHHEKDAMKKVALTIASGIIAGHLAPLLHATSLVHGEIAEKTVEKITHHVTDYVIEKLGGKGLRLDGGEAALDAFFLRADASEDESLEWLATQVVKLSADALEHLGGGPQNAPKTDGGREDFNPEQSRASNGQFGEGGGGSGSAPKAGSAPAWKGTLARPNNDAARYFEKNLAGREEVERYTETGYDDVNKYLNRGKEAFEDEYKDMDPGAAKDDIVARDMANAKEHADKLAAALRDAPKTPGEVMRGALLRDADLAKMKEGATIASKSFWSATNDITTANEFAENKSSVYHPVIDRTPAILHIDQKSAVDVSNVSSHGAEHELIMPPGVRMIVNKVRVPSKEIGGPMHIYMTEVP